MMVHAAAMPGEVLPNSQMNDALQSVLDHASGVGARRTTAASRLGQRFQVGSRFSNGFRTRNNREESWHRLRTFGGCAVSICNGERRSAVPSVVTLGTTDTI